MGLSYKKLEEKVKELEGRIKELETELYFCYRNKKIEKEVDGPKEIIELLKKIKSESEGSFEELGGS